MTVSAKLRAVIDRLRHPESFLGPVLTLVSGTALAHAITAVTLIILARLYSPDDFGVLGLFASIFYFLSVISCLRFDVAIPLPKDAADALDIFWLALLGGLALAALLTGLLLVMPVHTWAALGLGLVAPYLWLMPLALLATTAFFALQNWLVRQRSYAQIARARIAQSAGASAIQIGSGISTPTPIGLIAGFVFNSGTGALLILAQMWRRGELAALRPVWHRLPDALRKHSFYPRYSVWEALANSGGIQLPILIIGALVSEGEVGQLLLATSVVQAPMALFGTATAQVFLSQAPERARQGGLLDITRATTRSLFLTGGPILLAIGLAAPFAFPLLFGAEWARAGVIAAWMVPWLTLQFVASPVSMALYIANRQRLAMLLQVSGLLFRAGLTWVGATMLDGWATEAYAVSGAIFYGVMILLILRIVQTDSQRAI